MTRKCGNDGWILVVPDRLAEQQKQRNTRQDHQGKGGLKPGSSTWEREEDEKKCNWKKAAAIINRAAIEKCK